MVRSRAEWQRPRSFASDERVRQCLQRRQPLPRIHLQNLLHEVNELINFLLAALAVLNLHHVEAWWHGQLLRQCIIVRLLLELENVMRFEQLAEVQVLMIVLGNGVVALRL